MIVASFDVDAQNGFTPLCPTELPVVDGDKIVEALNEQAKLATIRVGSKDAHQSFSTWESSDENPIFSPVGLPNVDIHWPKHCVVGTFGGELLKGLPKETDYDFFVWKGIEKDLHPYSGCYHDLSKKLSTGVIEFLKSKNVTTVIVGGLAYSFCVKSTAIDLANAGFKVIINKSATRDIPGFEEKTNEELKNSGVVVIKDISEFR